MKYADQIETPNEKRRKTNSQSETSNQTELKNTDKLETPKVQMMANPQSEGQNQDYSKTEYQFLDQSATSTPNSHQIGGDYETKGHSHQFKHQYESTGEFIDKTLHGYSDLNSNISDVTMDMSDKGTVDPLTIKKKTIHISGCHNKIG